MDPDQQVATQAALQQYWQSVNDTPEDMYPDSVTVPTPDQVNLSVVRVTGTKDSTRFVVPGKVVGANVSFTALIDTGAQGCFVDRSFAANSRLCLTPKARPVRCISFDGSPGIAGVITEEWVGQLSLGDSCNSPVDFVLSATNLGSYQVIIGLPWLDAV